MKRLLLNLLCVLFAYPCFAAEPIQLARMNPWVAGSVAASCTWQTVWSYTPNTEATDSATRNWRNTVPANTSYDGIKIRITVQASSSKDGVISCSSIGKMTTGDVFDGSPTAITWGGNAGVTVPAGQQLVSDEITYSYDKTSRHGLHIYTTARNFVGVTGQENDGVYYNATDSSDCTTLDPTTSAFNSHNGVIKLEVCSP